MTELPNKYWLQKIYIVLSYVFNIYFILVCIYAFIRLSIASFNVSFSWLILFQVYLLLHAAFSLYLVFYGQKLIFRKAFKLSDTELLDTFEEDQKFSFKRWKSTCIFNYISGLVVTILPFVVYLSDIKNSSTNLALGLTLFFVGYGLLQVAFVDTVYKALKKENV